MDESTTPQIGRVPEVKKEMQVMKNFLLNLLNKTLHAWSFPFSHKRFDVSEVFEIEKELNQMRIPFAVGLCSTYGQGSNVTIRLANWWGRWDWKSFKSNCFHAFCVVDLDSSSGEYEVVEATGATGIERRNLVKALSGRDEVKIFVLREDLFSDDDLEEILAYINSVLKRDTEDPIPYDNAHDYSDEVYDCCELVYKAIQNSISTYNSKPDPIVFLSPVKRFGQLVWSPVDIESHYLFRKIYDSSEKK